MGTGGKVQADALTLPWDFDIIYFLFTNLLNQTIKFQQKQNQISYSFCGFSLRKTQT
jgi:hypothetical protein